MSCGAGGEKGEDFELGATAAQPGQDGGEKATTRQDRAWGLELRATAAGCCSSRDSRVLEVGDGGSAGAAARGRRVLELGGEGGSGAAAS
jgi:hypothetical protein